MLQKLIFMASRTDYSHYTKLFIFLKDKSRVYMYFKKLHIHFEDLRHG